MILSQRFGNFRMEIMDLIGVVHMHYTRSMQEMQAGFPDIVDSHERDKYLQAMVNMQVGGLDQWVCSGCTVNNSLKDAKCHMCGTARTEAQAAQTAPGGAPRQKAPAVRGKK